MGLIILAELKCENSSTKAQKSKEGESYKVPITYVMQ